MVVFLIFFLIEHDPVPRFQMYFHGTHLLGYVLACALYQPLAQIRGKLRPGIGADENLLAGRFFAGALMGILQPWVLGGMKTNMSGKLSVSVELEEGTSVKVKAVKRA